MVTQRDIPCETWYSFTCTRLCQKNYRLNLYHFQRKYVHIHKNRRKKCMALRRKNCHCNILFFHTTHFSWISMLRHIIYIVLWKVTSFAKVLFKNWKNENCLQNQINFMKRIDTSFAICHYYLLNCASNK